MKKSVFLLFFALVVFSSCEKADINGISSLGGNEQQLKEMIPPGHFFVYGNKTVWLDPDLVGPDGIDSEYLYFEDPTMSGYKTIINGCETIICNDEGSACGRVYIIDEGGVIFVGLYLC